MVSSLLDCKVADSSRGRKMRGTELTPVEVDIVPRRSKGSPCLDAAFAGFVAGVTLRCSACSIRGDLTVYEELGATTRLD